MKDSKGGTEGGDKCRPQDFCFLSLVGFHMGTPKA